PAGKAHAESLAHDRVRAIATGEIPHLAALFFSIGRAQLHADAAPQVGETCELRAPLDRYAELHEPLDQQPLALVLRIDLANRKGREVLADAAEGHPGGTRSTGPQVDGGHLVAALHDRLRKIALAVPR